MSGGAWTGGAFGTRGRCVLAPNPGMMTLDGTNTWVLREPGAERCVVVDPGPLDAGHLDAVVAGAGGPDAVALVLVTHHHHDHTEAVDALRERTGAPVRATSEAWCRDAAPLADDEEIAVDGLRLRVVHTPGHTADSTSFVLPDEGVLLSGDMVLGRGTTVVAHPDGQLGPYFSSVERMRALTAAGEVHGVWPAHGPVLEDAGAVLDHYLAHRRDRLRQVTDALATLGTAPADADPDAPGNERLPRLVVETVYADVDRALWAPAELSVRAQLAYLAGRV